MAKLTAKEIEKLKENSDNENLIRAINKKQAIIKNNKIVKK